MKAQSSYLFGPRFPFLSKEREHKSPSASVGSTGAVAVLLPLWSAAVIPHHPAKCIRDRAMC